MRLSIFFTLGISFLLFAFFLLSINIFKKELISEFDRSLTERFSYLERHLEISVSDKVQFRGSTDPNQIIIKGINDFAHVEVYAPTGELSFKNSKLVIPKIDLNKYLSFEYEKKNYRVKTGKVKNGYIIKAAFSLKNLNSRVGKFSFWYLSMMPISIAAVIFLSYFFARKALAPLKSIINHAVNINTNNLTERIQLENTEDELGRLATVLNEMFERVSLSFESLKRFTADSSHELRTPLTAIRSICEVAHGKNLNSNEYSNLLGSILEEIERMTALTNSLLMLARGDAGIYQIYHNDFDLNDCVFEVIELLNVLAEENQQEIIFEGASVIIFGDRALVRQAIMGLTHNALKYSPVRSKINLNLTIHSKKAILSVEDCGPGIPIEHQNKIFERFYRVEKSRNSKLGGSGLGLAIVMWIAKLHTGTVRYEENLSGSKFILELPSV